MAQIYPGLRIYKPNAYVLRCSEHKITQIMTPKYALRITFNCSYLLWTIKNTLEAANQGIKVVFIITSINLEFFLFAQFNNFVTTHSLVFCITVPLGRF